MQSRHGTFPDQGMCNIIESLRMMVSSFTYCRVVVDTTRQPYRGCLMSISTHTLFRYSFMLMVFIASASCGGGGSNPEPPESVANIMTNTGDTDENGMQPFLNDFPADIDICTAVDGGQNNVSISGVIERSKKWEKSELTVAFLPNQGSQNLRRTVLDLAGSWENFANIDFIPIDDRDYQLADIRISFLRGAGNWSLIGTDSAQRSQRANASMNLDITDGDSEARIGRIVLHEFGHALGMKHEHQNPAINIDWNHDVVYADLLDAEGWGQTEVDRNVFERLNFGTTNFTEFDPQSIMLYPIPARWTNDGFSTDWNSRLSVTDRQFIQEEYPFESPEPVIVRPIPKSFTSEAFCRKGGSIFSNPQCSVTKEFCADASPNAVIDVSTIRVTKLGISPASGSGDCSLSNRSNELMACMSMHRASTGGLNQLNAGHTVSCRIEFLERLISQ